MSITGHEIKTHFMVNKEEFDATMMIKIEGKDRELLSRLMNNICFEVNPNHYEFRATMPCPNTTSLERHIFVRRK